MKQIRVLHTEWSDGWGGQEIRIVSEMLAVREKGIEVHLACREEAQIRQHALEKGIPVHTFPFRGNTDFQTLWGLIRLIRREKIDIVNTHSGKDTWVGGLAAKLTGAKFIRTRHLSNPVNSSRLNFINELADFIITTGESVREDMIKNNRIDPDKILSVPTGIDEKRFSPTCCDLEETRQKFSIKDNEIAIGNVAVLRGFKRQDLLLKAAVELHRRHPNTRFFIAGEGPQRPILEKIIQENNMESYVTLLGHLEYPEELLRALDIFVLPSDSKEGVPQSLIQALMMQLPSVSTDVGSVRDLWCNKNFMLIQPGSVEAILSALDDLVQSKDLQRKFSIKANQCIRDFTLEAMGKKILNIYNRLF